MGCQALKTQGRRKGLLWMLDEVTVGINFAPCRK